MQQPEICCWHFFQKAAEPTDEIIRSKKSEIINSNNGSGQSGRSDARIKCERNRKDVGEADAVQQMKGNQPADRNFGACSGSDRRPGGESKKAGHGDKTTDTDFANFSRLG